MKNHKKRPREPIDEAKNSEKTITRTETNENDRNNSTPAMAIGGSDSVNDDIVVRGLRLEAIFHPKFDNERKKKGAGSKGSGNIKDGSGDIRTSMLRKLGIHPDTEPTEAHKGTGHLEVSLKHSGSLVLWSGSTRYYSKNSACNEFTRTAEILLRQRFETVRQAMLSSNSDTHDIQANRPCRSYEDCSRFISHNRYTVAFEVVTAEMLGDHGQVPNIDYVVVTAVADRANERFLSTTEVLEFCHRFRLPHNDVWTFFPPPTDSASRTGTERGFSSAERLFQIYDNSLRESGYTENTVQSLTEIADVYIPSPIPHSVFQGSICEGFIVRYVEDACSDESAREELEGLAHVARDILKEVPPPASAERIRSFTMTGDPVLDTDLRALYGSLSSNGEDNNGSSLQRQRATMFSESLKKLLECGNENENHENNTRDNYNRDDERQLKRPRLRKKRQDLQRIEKEKKIDGEDRDRANSTKKSISLASYHLPTLTKSLVDSLDKETRRIATLLQTLDGLKGGAIRYAWMEKHDENSTKEATCQQRQRLYCIIHVCNDSTFFKFQTLQSPSEMTLFRGFCVEVLLSSSGKTDHDQIDWGDGGKEENGDESGVSSVVDNELLWEPKSRPPNTSSVEGSSGAPLMLKMKLLPYMVRTFVCRNLLKTIQQKGPEEFERIALGLLDKWKISSYAQERWMPFFRGWAMYVLQCEEESPASNDGGTLELGNLTNFSYLRHLEHFTKLYESGKFRTVSSTDVSSPPEFHTFVCIVSQSTEVSMALAEHFAKIFNTKESSHKTTTKESKMKVCSLGEATKNHLSKSCIAYANVGDVTKGIKKFICDKKVVKRSIFILLGSNKDEIIALTTSGADSQPEGAAIPSWLDISSASEGKKLVGMWKPWKKFPCAKRIELGRSFVQFEPRRESSITADISSMSDSGEIIGAIKEVGTAVLEQETKKQSNSNSGGILVFFPGIPGCGKSSLVESSRLRVEEKMSLLAKEKGNTFNRNVHVKEGDKIGKNFWNIIEDLLSDDNITDGKSPTLVIADKNAPPASWQKLGQIGNDTNGIMLPVLPDSSVLETTTIEGSILPNGTLLPQASHFYPFSLKFLAVALARVLNRPAGEHSGKLDSGFPMACMVVVQFFSFYRYIGADTIQEKMGEKFDKDGAFPIKILKPLQVPFLTAAAQDEELPDDLKQLLVESIQLRHGHDKSKKFKVKKEDPQMIDMEKRMRSSIEVHRDKISAMTVSLEDTMEAFAAQIMERIESSCSKTNCIAQPMIHESQDEHNTVKLVSIDVDRVDIQKLLQKYIESGTVKKFFDSIQSLSPPIADRARMEEAETTMVDENGVACELRGNGNKGVKYQDPNFVECTHVTMAFAGEKNPPEKLISKFSHLQGREVKLSVTGLLWSSTIAALAIKISSSTTCDDSYSVPKCENAFAHITVWVAPDVKKSLSNQLPDLVDSGKAFRVDFEKEDVLVGKISFWNHKNEPFRV